MSPRRTILFVSLTLVAVGALSSGGAYAAQNHSFERSFGSAGSGADQIEIQAGTTPEPGSGIAVDSVTGDVYVADTGNNRVDEFEADGTFIRAFGWGVLDGSAELQQCTTITTCGAGLAGTGPGELDAPVFVAVDDGTGGEGDVYAANRGEEGLAGESPQNLVTKFDGEGHLVKSWGVEGQLNGSSAIPGGGFGRVGGIAAGPAGELWVYEAGTTKAGGNGHLYEFGRDSAFERSLQPERLASGSFSPQGIATDPIGDLYLSRGAATLDEYASGGAFRGSLYSAPGQTISSFALDPSTRDLYVDERDQIQDVSHQCEPSNNGCEPTQTFGAAHLAESSGTAVAPDGTVYAANAGGGEIAVFPVSLEATVVAPSEVKATSANLGGIVNPKVGGPVTRCFFRTGSTASYGTNLPCLDEGGQPVGTASTPITSSTAVHAVSVGLEGGTSYHYSLRAFNSGEELTSEDEVFETLPIPLISDALAKELTATSATLEARVDPVGLAVTGCAIQWGTSTSYGNTIACDPPTLPAGTSPLPVTVKLEGLAADATYHWRVVATNHCNPGAPSEVCTATGTDNTFVFTTGKEGSPAGSCPNEALRQANGSLALPDCRAYELVTPPQKNGALFAPTLLGHFVNLAADGSRLIASTLQCFDSSPSCTGDRLSKGPPFALERTSSGWIAHPLAPPASEFELNSVWSYSADTGDVLYSSPITSPDTDEFYARESDGSMSAVGPIGESGGFGLVRHVSSLPLLTTRDLSHVIYSGENSLWSFDASRGETLYEYAGAGNDQPLLVAVSGGPGSNDLIGTCKSSVSDESHHLGQALSADGRTMIFPVGACEAGGSGVNSTIPVPASEVWARIDGESADARSVELSARSSTGCTATCESSRPEDAEFEGASEDGGLVYFSSAQQLKNEATQGSRNLYLYLDPQQTSPREERAPDGSRLVDVSAGDTSGRGPDVHGVMATSSDGSHVYYVAGGILSGPNAEGNSPTEGADNLYAYERDGDFPEGHTVFIATLPGGGSLNPAGEEPESVQWTGAAEHANVSPDGGYLLFTSHGALTPDTASRPEAPAQVFRYDAESEQLRRISLGRRGFDDNGNAGTGEAAIAEAGQSRRDPSMSDDGSRVFFQSPVALTPNALNDVSVNGRQESPSLAKNIYEWRAPGDECDESSGCVSLISDGKDATETVDGGTNTTYSSVKLLGTDALGEDVFFTTTDPLVPADTDTGYDIYDARAGGGFAPAPAPTICQGDACKGQGTQASSAQGAATSTFSGAEEGPKHSAVPKCKKGFVRKGSRCVKKQKQKKHHKKKADKGSKRAASTKGGGKK